MDDNNEEIKTNIDDIYDDEKLDVEHDEVIEFNLGEFIFLEYSLTNNIWKTWYLNEEGEEIEEYYTMEEYRLLSVLVVNTIMLKKEQLDEYLLVIMDYLKERDKV
jgi:hypothetical protein